MRYMKAHFFKDAMEEHKKHRKMKLHMPAFCTFAYAPG